MDKTKYFFEDYIPENQLRLFQEDNEEVAIVPDYSENNIENN